MESILEYIMSHYTLFLGGAILILLAIIGRYADKTNFGQGKETKEDKEINFGELKEQSTDQVLVNPNEVINEQNKLSIQSENNDSLVESPKLVSEKVHSTIEQDKQVNFDDKFKEFDKQFDELVPQKSIVNDDLLDEIESLSLDKTQKINLNDIPDLDDVELPKIKALKPEEQDIWKF